MGKIKNNTLILGIGNEILTDDGIGPKLVHELERTLDLPDVTFDTASLGGMDILELIRGFTRVIIIDAIRTKDGTPGTVYQLTPEYFRETLHVSNFHDISFLPALDLAKKMDIPVPEQIDIIAIEIVEDLTFSNEFSPPIARKYDEIYREVVEIIIKNKLN
jgi:hydrogenase maturation protease